MAWLFAITGLQLLLKSPFSMFISDSVHPGLSGPKCKHWLAGLDSPYRPRSGLLLKGSTSSAMPFMDCTTTRGP